MIWLELFWTFFTIGALTFGGGYAMLPLIQSEVARQWGTIITNQNMIDFVAVSESTPGPFAVNMATYVGAELGGVFGSFCATLGVVLPSFLIIFAISFVLQKFQNNQAVIYAFNGIRAGVLALLCKALWGMYKKNKKNWASYTVMAGAFILTAILDVSVLPVIIGCAIFGLVTAKIMERKVQK